MSSCGGALSGVGLGWAVGVSFPDLSLLCGPPIRHAVRQRLFLFWAFPFAARGLGLPGQVGSGEVRAGWSWGVRVRREAEAQCRVPASASACLSSLGHAGALGRFFFGLCAVVFFCTGY